eukprot:73393-Prymnesium_polylepis.2
MLLAAMAVAFVPHRRDSSAALTLLRGGHADLPAPREPFQPPPPRNGRPPLPAGHHAGSTPPRPPPPQQRPHQPQPQQETRSPQAPQVNAPQAVAAAAPVRPCPQPGVGVDFNELEARCGVRLSWH